MRPDDQTFRDLGLLTWLTARPERTMANVAAMTLGPVTEDEYLKMLASFPTLQAQCERAISYWQAQQIADFATRVESWIRSCLKARESRHTMVHGITSTTQSGQLMYWHDPKTREESKFDGVGAMLMIGDVMELIDEGKELVDLVHRRIYTQCSSQGS